jgi:hypothetical protein
MKRATFYLTEETLALIEHLWLLRRIDGNIVSRGQIIAEAMVCLSEQVNQDHQDNPQDQ